MDPRIETTHTQISSTSNGARSQNEAARDSAAQSSVPDAASFEQAYMAVQAEILALPAESLVRVNLDIFAAVTTACGVIPELKALRPEIARRIPYFDLKSFDNLHNHALACGYAHGTHKNSTKASDNLQTLKAEAVRRRDALLNDASALAYRGILDPASLSDLRGPVGYQNAASDLQRLVSLLKANWDKIAGKTPTTLDELEEGAALVTRIVNALGLREQGPAHMAVTADLRMRAFTLFTRTYDDARSAVIFLRWKQRDADTIIPSLYAGRGGRRKEHAPTTDASDNSPITPEGSVDHLPAAPVVAGPPVTTPVAASTPAHPLQATATSGGPFMS